MEPRRSLPSGLLVYFVCFSFKASYLLASLHFSNMFRQKLHTVLQVKVDKPELGKEEAVSPGAQSQPDLEPSIPEMVFCPLPPCRRPTGCILASGGNMPLCSLPESPRRSKSPPYRKLALCVHLLKRLQPHLPQSLSI